MVLVLPGQHFLKIEPGSRPVGMGGAFTGLANDINTIFWNPAGSNYHSDTGTNRHATLLGRWTLATNQSGTHSAYNKGLFGEQV